MVFSSLIFIPVSSYRVAAVFYSAEKNKECGFVFGEPGILRMGGAGLRSSNAFLYRCGLYAWLVGRFQFKEGKSGKSKVFCNRIHGDQPCAAWLF